MTAKKSRTRAKENPDYAGFVIRSIRAYGRRLVEQGDVHGLNNLAAMDAEIAGTMQRAVDGLRERGFSWAEISREVGVTRQAAQQRWGR